jgi:hypothetical protein
VWHVALIRQLLLLRREKPQHPTNPLSS